MVHYKHKQRPTGSVLNMDRSHLSQKWSAFPNILFLNTTFCCTSYCAVGFIYACPAHVIYEWLQGEQQVWSCFLLPQIHFNTPLPSHRAFLIADEQKAQCHSFSRTHPWSKAPSIKITGEIDLCVPCTHRPPYRLFLAKYISGMWGVFTHKYSLIF